ncbi:MAG: hypothetical protein DME86_07710 [Verrucomicrobia bacterium]|nr:MAG: hypothetical protein DME86_07710 [Verrucomicrobiota bacterium]
MLENAGLIFLVAMPRFIAFLRAISVGGRNVTMDKLGQVFEAAGFDKVETSSRAQTCYSPRPGRTRKRLKRRLKWFQPGTDLRRDC